MIISCRLMVKVGNNIKTRCAAFALNCIIKLLMCHKNIFNKFKFGNVLSLLYLHRNDVSCVTSKESMGRKNANTKLKVDKKITSFIGADFSN